MVKRDHTETFAEESAPKRAKLLDESSEEEDEAQDSTSRLKINSEYASRFEHNKKREERQRLEEKYGGALEDSEDDSSSSDDDEEAELVNEDVDRDILATIQALRSKDPRIYDKSATFFKESNGEEGSSKPAAGSKQKAMTLKDYHRENLMKAAAGDEDTESGDQEPQPKSYVQEQAELKNDVVKQMHAAAEEASDESGSDDENGFLVRKSEPEPQRQPRKTAQEVELDVKSADKDPETFLSNFLTSNTWRSTSPSRFEPFESDDDEEMRRADEFEEAYNRRFDDPHKSNIVLQSYDRPTIAKYSVRREELSGRQKARQAEKAVKDAEKTERAEERARLKRLKVEEMERKVKQIRKSAGAHGKKFSLDDWKEVLEADFEDDRWEAEMQRRFDEEYYKAMDEDQSGDEGNAGANKKLRKPKWDDDIDVKDIIPDFSEGEEEDDAPSAEENEDDAEDTPAEAAKPNKRKANKDRVKAREEAKRDARRDRRLIENMVESNLAAEPVGKAKTNSSFHYRETSPMSFGLSSRDILFANDKDLNAYAGIKKLHAFRDPEKKKKDKKNLSKKARLRQWRKDTFGDAEEPKGGFEKILKDQEMADASEVPEVNQSEEAPAKKKKKRSRKSKQKSAPLADVAT